MADPNELLQALHITDHDLMGKVIDICFEDKVFAVDLRLHHSHHTVHQLSQIDFLLRKHNASALDFGHIEHFVDEA